MPEFLFEWLDLNTRRGPWQASPVDGRDPQRLTAPTGRLENGTGEAFFGRRTRQADFAQKGRRHVRARGFIVLALWLFLAGAECLAADTLEQFKQAKPELLPMLRSKEPQDRIEAVRRLKAFPVEDSVKLIHACLNDEDPSVSKETIASRAEASRRRHGHFDSARFQVAKHPSGR